MEVSPLRRAAEQPPCSAADEAACLVGVFAVPARMAIDLSPHIFFPEHISIYQAMQVAGVDPVESFWWRTFCELRRTRTAAETRQLIGILIPAQKSAVVSDSEDGRLIFAVSLTNLRRCTIARQELSAIQSRATVLYRVPSTPYNPEEKRRLFGPIEDIGWDIP